MIEIRPELGFPQRVVAPPRTNINIGLHEDGDIKEFEIPIELTVTGPWANGGYPVAFIDVDGQLKCGAYYLHQPPPENNINPAPTLNPLNRPNDQHQV